MSLPLRESARAKVNLSLAVTGRDDAGYHCLETLMAFAEGAEDEVTLAIEGDRDGLTIKGPFASALANEDDNLMLRATRLVRELRPDLPFLQWTLDKHLPVAAGLGGGSADAGAALRLMRRIVALDDGTIGEIAVRLGADVPIALYDRPAWATRRGDRLAPVSLARIPAVLVNPGSRCETSAVFKAYRDMDGAFSASRPVHALMTDRTVAWCESAGNDLTKAAIAVAPPIANVLSALSNLATVRYAGMSGSGATCFGLFDDVTGAATAADRLSKAHPNWWVRAVIIG